MERIKKEIIAFFVSPLICTFPLLPLFAVPISPLFLGKMIPEMNSPWGSFCAVFISGTILGYVSELSVGLGLYIFLHLIGVKSRLGLLAISLFTGVMGALYVRAVQDFRQIPLREFAVSLWPLPLGAICGLTSGLLFYRIIDGFGYRDKLSA